MAINPEMKLNKYGKGKYLLRHAFEGLGYLPDDILWREKAAFSDAVGHSMVDYLKAFAEKYFTDAEFEAENLEYDHARPFTKESLLYRELFEKYYPNLKGLRISLLPYIDQQWMENIPLYATCTIL
jgi:asparagine synthase (glutamine-hydrolysing)